LASSSSSSIVTATANLEIQDQSVRERLPPLLEAFSNNKETSLARVKESTSITSVQASNSTISVEKIEVISNPNSVFVTKKNLEASVNQKSEPNDSDSEESGDENELFIDLDANSIHVTSISSQREKSVDVQMCVKKETEEQESDQDDDDDEEGNVILDLDNNIFIKNPPSVSSIKITKITKEKE
jgi:hypothetical protein